eukprot:536658_1
MHSLRHKGPKSTEYNELEKMINQYYEALQKKQQKNASRFFVNIRKHILLKGCPRDDIISERDVTNSSTSNDTANNAGRHLFTRIERELPTMRRVEDTLRGKVWRLLLGVGNLDA